MVERLAKANTGVDYDFPRFNPMVHRLANLPDKEIFDLAHDVVVPWFHLHGPRGSLHVHENDRNFFSRHKRNHLRVETEGADVVNHIGARFQSRPGDLTLVGIDGKRNIHFLTKRSKDGNNSLLLHFGRYWLGSRTRRLAADIDDIRPCFH